MKIKLFISTWLIDLSLILCLFFITCAYAGTEMPVFNGFYYEDFYTNKLDACGKSIGYYKNTFTDAQKLANELTSDLPQENCRWDNSAIPDSAHDTSMPPDFPGSSTDWQNISSDKSLNPQTHIINWVRYCRMDGKIIDNQHATTVPSYTCKKGTEFSWMYGTEHVCSTSPISCEADVVLRDLNTKGKWGDWLIKPSFGHIGLIADPYSFKMNDTMVMEVLTDKIQKNTLTDFKTKTTYHGERFGLSELPKEQQYILTMEQAKNIIKTGGLQTQYPFIYTFLPWYHPAGTMIHYYIDPITYNIISALTYRIAIFRCDTFIYYCYQQGAGIIISGFHSYDYPAILFNLFLYSRNPIASNYEYSLRKTLKKLNFYFKNSDEENTIKKLFAEDKPDFESVEKALMIYVNDSFIINLEKQVFLWSQAVTYQDNEVKFKTLLDTLAQIRAIDICEQMIANYSTQKNLANQIAIINTLTDSIFFQTLSSIQQLTPQQKQKVVNIENFLQSVVNNANNANILRVASLSLSSIYPGEKSYNTILNALKRYNKKNNEQASFLNSDEIALISVNSALTSADNIDFLNNLLNQINKASKIERSMFNKKLYLFINSQSIGVINKNVKNILSAYIQSQYPFIADSADIRSAQHYYNWLKALALVSSTTNTGKINFILNYLYHVHNTQLLNYLITIVDDDVLLAMDNRELKLLLESLQTNSIYKNNLNTNTNPYSLASILRIKRLLGLTPKADKRFRSS